MAEHESGRASSGVVVARRAAESPTAPAPAHADARPQGGTADAARNRRAGWLILALAGGIAFALIPFVGGLLGGPVLAVATAPAYRWLRARIGAEPAAFLIAVVTLMLLLLPGAILVTGLAAQAPNALAQLQQSEAFRRLAQLRIGGFDVGSALASSGSDIASWLSRQTGALVGSVTHAMLNLLIALFGTYYTLTAGHETWWRLAKHLPFSTATSDHLRRRFHDVTEAMLLGIVLTALVQGAVVAAGFAIVSLPNPLFWGFVTACVSVLPILGSSLVWLPGAAVLALDQRYGAALLLVAIGAILASNLDNLVRPLVYRRVSNVHPMVTLVGAFAGVRLFGLAGLLLGPLAICYLIELLAVYEHEEPRANHA